jgi:hypothetical protein
VTSPAPVPGWCSTAIRDLVAGPVRDGYVAAGGELAAYLTFDGDSPAVMALVGPGAVRLPIAMQVPHLRELRTGRPALIGGDRVAVGATTWRPARWWNPRPHLDASRLRRTGRLLEPLVGLLPDEAFGVPTEDALAAARGLAAGDPGAAVAILGAGPGFTPAGDDVVAGALAALSLSHLLDPRARDAVLTAATDRTTTVSAALLHCASRGQVVPAAARLLTVLSSPGQVGLDAAADSLFAVGSTSGPALALGLAASLAALRTSEMETT